ncbi:hypothetical protein [Prosthecobacter fluviatilis]|uniref:Uncharacterized protein n=1 Tax=Prosthecobacter fluviatilis TaxID=445931 RepID=A0ABW0KPH4_9BACT
MSEESKIWVSLSLLTLLVVFCFTGQYLSSVDTANVALSDSKSRLALIQDQLTKRKKFWAEKEQFVQKLKAETEKNATLLGLRDTLDQRFDKADSDLKQTLDSMREWVDRTRKNAPGTDLGEVKLASGKVLRGVKIRKVEDSGISFIHDDGVGSIPADQAPETLKEQYDLGPNALVPMIEKAQAALFQNPGEESIISPSMPAAPPPFVSSSPAPKASIKIDEAKIKRIKLRMAELDAAITSYTNLVSQYRKTAASHQELAQNAKYRGTPTTRHTENANKVLAQAAALESQMASMREERSKLAVELDFAVMGK